MQVWFTIPSKRIKNLGINLITKEDKDLYTENYKTLLKETKDDTNKWKDILFLWNGRLNIVKVSVLLKTICRFYQNQNGIFCINRKIHPKIHMESQWTPCSQTNPEGQEYWGLTVLDFKTCKKATVIKTMCITGIKTDK